MPTATPRLLEPTLTEEEFEGRLAALHNHLFASTEFAFDEVTTHVYRPPEHAQVDHSFFHDGQNWHFFYNAYDPGKLERYRDCVAAGDWDGAAQSSIETGMGHAVGPSLFDLAYRGRVEPTVQGRFDILLRSNGWVFQYDGRYGMLYGVRGADSFIGFSLIWSDDLEEWRPGNNNPVLQAPAWAAPRATCKDVHIIEHRGAWLLYVVTAEVEASPCIGLFSTTDWKTFNDHGCVFRANYMLRGTMGIESPAIVLRDGVWHLFITYGPGLWHAVGRSPDRFRGIYYLGPFHAAEVLRDPHGDWWLTTDRKEEMRRQYRLAGRLNYRATYEDDKVLEEGLYVSRIRWHGDCPILENPSAVG